MPASAATTWCSGWTARRSGFTQMGGEGANWIGEAPFSKRAHVFQNLGDGTYNHSGYLAIRAAIASGVNITYKILFNDAVAMTGGQTQRRRPHGAADRAPGRGRRRQARRRRHRRAGQISDRTPTGRAGSRSITATISTRCSASLPRSPAVTVLIYDQTCAAEKRRRRKRGQFPDPDKRVIINELVCEGCGDCGVQSNCVSVQPLETEFGRKRTIDQSSCNKDFSCVKGFCPSFVTVHGAQLKKGSAVAAPADLPPLPEPALPDDRPDLRHHRHRRRRHRRRHRSARSSAWRRISKARASACIDMAGPRAEGRRGVQPHPHRRQAGRHPRHPRRGARRRSGARRRHRGRRQQEGARRGEAGRTHDGRQHRRVPARRLHPQRRLLAADRAAQARDRDGGRARAARHFIDASRLATALFGNSIGANMFMLGYAYQLGALPLSAAGDRAGDRAQRRSGGDEHRRVPLGPPRRGRSRRRSKQLARADGAPIRRASCRSRSTRSSRAASPSSPPTRMPPMRARYRDAGREGDGRRGREGAGQVRACRGGRALSVQADGLQGRVRGRAALHRRRVPRAGRATSSTATTCASSSISRRRCSRAAITRTGVPRKMTFGPWMLPAFRLLAKLKFLRGTAFDPFGYTPERRTERKLIADYEAMLDEVLRQADAGQPSPRGRACGDPGEDPRLRPRQAAPSHGRQGRRGGAARAVPRRRRRRCSRRRNKPCRYARADSFPQRICDLTPRRLDRAPRCLIKWSKDMRQKPIAGRRRRWRCRMQPAVQGATPWRRCRRAGGYVSQAVDSQRRSCCAAVRRSGTRISASGRPGPGTRCSTRCAPSRSASATLGLAARRQGRRSSAPTGRGSTGRCARRRRSARVPVPVYADCGRRRDGLRARARRGHDRGRRGPGAGRQDPVGLRPRCRSSRTSSTTSRAACATTITRG